VPTKESAASSTQVVNSNYVCLVQCFSKWAESPLGGDFDGQGGEKMKGGDRGRKNTKGAKMFNH